MIGVSDVKNETVNEILTEDESLALKEIEKMTDVIIITKSLSNKPIEITEPDFEKILSKFGIVRKSVIIHKWHDMYTSQGGWRIEYNAKTEKNYYLLIDPEKINVC